MVYLYPCFSVGAFSFLLVNKGATRERLLRFQLSRICGIEVDSELLFDNAIMSIGIWFAFSFLACCMEPSKQESQKKTSVQHGERGNVPECAAGQLHNTRQRPIKNETL